MKSERLCGRIGQHHRRGFAFIITPDRRYFCHVSDVETGSLPEPDSIVEFTPRITPRGFRAVNVRPVRLEGT